MLIVQSCNVYSKIIIIIKVDDYKHYYQETNLTLSSMLDPLENAKIKKNKKCPKN